MVVGVLAIDKVLDDPVGALSAHGLAGIWGTLVVRHLHGAALRGAERRRRSGPHLQQLASTSSALRRKASLAAFGSIFVASFAIFWLIKKTIGLRVSPEQEEAGLDIVEHGMYGYPEQFIPPEEGDVPFLGGCLLRRCPR